MGTMGGPVHVIAKRTLREFWEKHPDAEQPLKAWHAEASRTTWSKPADITSRYRTASAVGSDRIVFRIAGNKYRLVVRINYGSETVFIRFAGTHEDYDEIDAETV